MTEYSSVQVRGMGPAQQQQMLHLRRSLGGANGAAHKTRSLSAEDGQRLGGSGKESSRDAWKWTGTDFAKSPTAEPWVGNLSYNCCVMSIMFVCLFYISEQSPNKNVFRISIRFNLI